MGLCRVIHSGPGVSQDWERGKESASVWEPKICWFSLLSKGGDRHDWKWRGGVSFQDPVSTAQVHIFWGVLVVGIASTEQKTSFSGRTCHATFGFL